MSEIALPMWRSDVGRLLDGQLLGKRLHCLHDSHPNASEVHDKDKLKKKQKKKGKTKAKDKSKVKREKSPEKPERTAPEIHLHGNPSAFAVYASIRQMVLEDHQRQISQIYLQACQARGAESDSDDELLDKSHELQQKLPKIVSIGLCSVIEIIRETQLSHPMLCCRALHSLLDILQGQQPEGLRTEPAEVIDSLYHLLMDLAQSRSSCSADKPESETLTALACSCVLSLVVARGDTGKLLTAVASMLMFSSKLATQVIKLPCILTSLQKSVLAVLIGKTVAPDWLTHGIRYRSRMSSVALADLRAQWPPRADFNAHMSLASDGRYIYLHGSYGLVKLGSGYGNTVKGHVYATNSSFKCKEDGWLAVVKDKLLYKQQSDVQGTLLMINKDTLVPMDKTCLESKNCVSNITFSDGEHLGHIASFRDDSFVVRTFDPFQTPMVPASELTLKLARKCLEVFGAAAFDSPEEVHGTNCGIEEDALSVGAGRDFALLRTASNKVYYTGKSQALGTRPTLPLPGGNAKPGANSNVSKWAELPIVKSPKIVQCSVGHDGSHGLLVAEDGSVFFVGTAKRGEDGDTGSLSKARRQVKPVKPKKMIRLEGKTVIYSACNSGTSALVTRDGEVYMFGKDAVYCESSTGFLSDVKGIAVTSVALGKAHGVLLTNKGQVYTFGLNNKGQCGREFVAGGSSKELSVAITMADDEDDIDEDGICPPGKHHWEVNQCMICTVCAECTGYGNSCINSGRPDRSPGQPCGCGTGESGCADCGCCKSCAGERGARVGGNDVYNGRLVDALARAQEPMPFDLFIGRHRARLEGRKGLGKLKRASSRLKANIAEVVVGGGGGGGGGSGGGGGGGSSGGAGSDYEQGPLKMASVPPGCLEIGLPDTCALQVACGLHHTVVLLNNGEVYAFGSNQYGQLGFGDTTVRGTPTLIPLRSSAMVKQVAAGSNHTVLLTASGQVYTFGCHKKGQLGRPIEEEDHGAAKDPKSSSAVPGVVPGIGAKHGRRATWVGASGDQTFLRIDESLINIHTLSRSNIVANPSCIVLIPMVDIGRSNIKCLAISRLDGTCRSFSGSDQVNLIDHSVCLDAVNNVLWSVNQVTLELDCYNAVFCEVNHLNDLPLSRSSILSPELAIPVLPGSLCSRSHCAINLLGCLDILTLAHQLNMTVTEEAGDKHTTATTFSKDDFSVVNRFESHGGGWGYSGHSIEAIRFMCDTDVVIGGYGLFGGRGEYFGKIKLFELGPDAGDNETEGELLAETEEMPYKCGAREKHVLLFDEPVPIQANSWYVAWARISGPSSDCGSSGQTTVTTQDQIVFRFRNSKKSNNGTDSNAGQIPQLLYHLPSPDLGTGMTGSCVRKCEQVEQVHILTSDFSLTVSPECFESLMSLLSWSWSTFCSLGADVPQMKGMNYKAALFDLQQLVYTSAVSLRLICTYICEIYPWQATKTKASCETTRLAECVGEVRLLLRQILSESNRYPVGNSAREGQQLFTDGSSVEALRETILRECHRTFTMCFHAFYPTGNLKWICLCELLTTLDLNRDGASGSGRLLAAVMEAMCHPAIKLTAIMPINGDHIADQQLVHQRQPGIDDNIQCSSLLSETLNFPMLVGHMMHRTEVELIGRGNWTLKDMIDRLLYIAGLPLRQAINQEKVTASSSLVYSACCLLVALVSELSAAATGTEVTVTISSRPLLSTPNRFTRTSAGTYWNTGNGSPDAVCFTVNRPGIVIAGVGLYGGGGTYEYELELLDDMEKSNNDASPTSRWNSLEIVKGTYGPDDCVNEIAEIKFSKPIPIKENVNYAVRLRNRGNRTKNGDSGLPRVKCPDGTVFSFNACSLSSNGTNHSRGQIPLILYYSSPQDGEAGIENSHSIAESQLRRNTIGLVTTIFHSASELLRQTKSIQDGRIFTVINSCPMFSVLLPLVAAYLRPVAMSDPWGAVKILSLIREILPHTAAINRLNVACGHSSARAGHSLLKDEHFSVESSSGTGSTSSHCHYAIVESDHPYKPASVSNYKVTFQACVRWMLLEFDPQSGTAQVEDYLQLFVPARAIPVLPMGSSVAVEQGETSAEVGSIPTNWWPILRKFHGRDNWPSMAMVLPGNEVCFSLETASDYVKDEKSYTYGFKCTVVGYEWPDSTNEELLHLERELADLGGVSAASLMRKDLILPLGSTENSEDDMSLLEAAAQQVFSAHSALLNKGFLMFHMPSVVQALEGNLPFNCSSYERTFLKDFINCNSGTCGGRLASWLQPEPYLDPKKCSILYNHDELRCNWPVTITIQTKDQYGHLVKVPHLKVEAKAVPIIKEMSEDRRVKCISRCETEGSLVFGGLPPPRLDIPYKVTVRDKDLYHAISMMKAFENYSFEELRYAAPTVRRPTENMLIRDNQDGTYSASWTPGGIGFYNVHVKLDNFDTGEVFKVEVHDAPQGVTPPLQPQSTKRQGSQGTKMRKFVMQQSAGLRVRLHPSLQSEQIGVIKPGGVITFTSEIHNNDGVWLRLSCDSIRTCCSPLNGYTEGWALQYNQHLGKTMLVPVEEPRPMADAGCSDSPSQRGPDPARGACAVGAAPGRTYPCTYTTVKCGFSGHNIRVIPDLDSPAIGMVILGNQLTAIGETITADGAWVQLDKTSMQSYCHETEGDAWCLVRTSSGDVYLSSDLETDSPSGASSAPFCVTKQPMTGGKGFDFTMAAKIPTCPAFATGQPEFCGSGNQQLANGGLQLPFGYHHIKESDIRGRSVESEGATSFPVPWAASAATEPMTQDHMSVPDPLGKSRSASLKREELPFCLPLNSYKSASAGYLGEPMSVGRRDFPQPRIHLQFPDLPPELQGVSVKDLVKALGESRVNGNGVTPPRTPPGTPKKTLSRSSSPKASGTVVHDLSSLNGGSTSFRRESLQPHGPHFVGSPSKTSAAANSSSVQPSVATKSSPTSRNVVSPAVSQKLPASPNNGSCDEPKMSAKSFQRSISSSPQRVVVAISETSGRSSSASPVRGEVVENGSLETPEITQRHFLLGPPLSKDDVRSSSFQKATRKDRSRNLRSKRERATSPSSSAKEKTTCSSQSHSSVSPKAKVPEVAHEAMAPSVSHCIRAVFAAFLWHEGIVHDAMACASFLKFHPDIGKDVQKKRSEDSAPIPPPDASSGSDDRKVEETKGQRLKRPSASDRETGTGNINEMRKSVAEASPTKIPPASHLQIPKPLDTIVQNDGPTNVQNEPTVLPTLCHLVSFWEEFSSITLRVVEQNLIVPSPLTAVKELDKDDKDKSIKGKPKKTKENRQVVPGARGNLFGEAAGGPLFAGPVGADKDTMCELCNQVFPHPVTYHMRQSHPGCGKLAAGQGYNSGGNFCGGWAGNCGDGGMGGSTWYLMCDTCRGKYLRDRIQVPKDRLKKTKKKSVLMKQSSCLQTMEPHVVMKNNAMFILDVASACSIQLPSQQPSATSSNRCNGQLPVLCEDMATDQCVFPMVPFSYLNQCGACAADSAFSEDDIFTGQISSSSHRIKTQISEPALSQSPEAAKKRVRPNSILVVENSSLEDSLREAVQEAGNMAGRLSDGEDQYPSRMTKAFQRSISELGSDVLTNMHAQVQPFVEMDRAVKGLAGEWSSAPSCTSNDRQKNNGCNVGYGSGLSLLKHPSAAMSRLIQASEKSRNDRELATDTLPVMKFCTQRHDLDSLQFCMKLALCKASCRTYALEAFNWLVRQVTQLECLHGLFWHFVSALSTVPAEDDDEETVAARKEKKGTDPEKGMMLCEHPLSDITNAGDAVVPLTQAFHTFLQTISDVMMYLPSGSSIQQMAVRCWCLKFQLSDHIFLHRSHVFSNISKILSKSEEGWDPSAVSIGFAAQNLTEHVRLQDLTAAVDVKASSRQAMIASVTDSSTETFWESGDEDKNKSKTITITCTADHRPIVVYVHIDNARDLGNKVSSVVFSGGSSLDDLLAVRQVDLELRFAGWVSAWLPSSSMKIIRVELKGPDNSLRVRQVKVLGEVLANEPLADPPRQHSPLVVQQKNCEADTLKVFRLLTSQVFGQLINGAGPSESRGSQVQSVVPENQVQGDVNLKEHMVSILFSRSKLTQLQKQVCVHIVQAIRKETIRVQEQWEDGLTERGKNDGAFHQSSDAYCFELLSLVLALSGSTVGRHYLAQQHSLLEDLVSLLHTASPRVQRQVLALIRRVLLDVSPKVLAGVLGVLCLPPSDFSILSTSSEIQYDPNHRGLLDVFLACIAKALTVQVKSKLPSGGKGKNTIETFHLADCFPVNNVLPGRWWFRGTISVQLAEAVIGLLKDLSAGKITREWAAVTKSAIAEPVLNLLHLSEALRNPSDCLKTPAVWLTMAALCVLSDEHVEQLSSGQWGGKGDAAQTRPTCENHDDGETQAMILCNDCGNLCADCDRILHLHRRSRGHQRQVFKEEEEAIKVDLHEGCGRIKLYWLLALADSKTLKAVVEFRNASKDKVRSGHETLFGAGSLEPCRFCGTMTHPGLMTVGTVCSHPECQEHAKNACARTLPCGHACGGICDEDPCLLCLHGCSAAQEALKQDADDMCMICFTEALSAAPAIQLACGHVFHWHCCRQVLQRLWPGPRITFGFSRCPICKADIMHRVLDELLQPIRSWQEDVRRKSLMRLEYEGLHKADAITTAGMSFHNDPAGYAMDRYAYYVCFKCKKAYHGGEARCEEQAAAPDDYDPSELVCGACSDVSRAQMCSRHGADFLEYKCRYCCSVAIFFCFGTTHFCNACHEDFQRVTTIPKNELPHCPAGPKAKQLEGEECPLHVVHPPTGEEFALGCGICRNANTF